MPDDDALAELARWTGETLDDLRQWEGLGLLPHEPSRTLGQRLERVGLIRFAIERGYGPERLAEIAAAHGDMIGPFAEQVGEMVGEPVCTTEEALERAGIPSELIRPLLTAAGLGDATYATQEDLATGGLLKAALDLGLPVEVLTQMLRVYVDSTYKVADAGSRLFHLHVHEQMRTGGAGGAELLDRTNALAGPLQALLDPAVLYFHHKAWQRAFREDMMLHLAEEMTAPSEVPGEFTRAFLFVDLSSFTPLTEAMGDAAAAVVVERFADIVREATGRCTGQVVKQIGDEFMLVFPDGRAAARCGVAIQEMAAAEPRFPALRMGAHLGSVLYREGDYLGTAVNTAARVAGTAVRHQFLVTGAVQQQLGDLDVEVVPVGARALKGLSEETELFEVHGALRPPRMMDPVCGIELDEESSDAELNWKGERLLFCSENCLRRFLDKPDRYAPGEA